MPRPRNFSPRFSLPFMARFACGLTLMALCRASFAQSPSPLSSPSASHFTPGSPLVRVGLMAWTNARQITLRSLGGARLTGMDGEEIAAGLGPWNVIRSGGAYLISDAQNHTLGVLSDGSRWRLQCENADALACLVSERGAVTHYRGAIEIALRSGHLQVVNEVALETYLRGVVSREMGRAPLEALKAQAVAARTFAVSHFGQWAADGYDVRDTTDSQVYAGANGETPDSDAAISFTTGAILMQNQKPIAAQFCADCGGACVPDSDGISIHDADAHGVANPKPPGWTVALPSPRLLALLQAALKFSSPAPPDAQNPKTKTQNPEPNDNDTLDPIAAYDPEVLVPPTPVPAVSTLDLIEILRTDASGRVLKMRYAFTLRTKIKGKTKSEKRQGELSGASLRTLLGVNILKSTLFTVKKDESGNFIFTGRGWGHGHGMCQTGAMALAAAPFQYDFRAILARYYPAATVGQLTYLEPENTANESRNTSQSAANLPQSEAKIGHR